MDSRVGFVRSCVVCVVQYGHTRPVERYRDEAIERFRFRRGSWKPERSKPPGIVGIGPNMCGTP